ncbi:MAG TPA: hypothetical protein VMZ50_04985, partial [Phycisphaerae bacterium]|nr:hypothetical protein [Phycisphaerae bacterium]
MASLDMMFAAHVVHGDGFKLALDEGVLPEHIYDDGEKIFSYVRGHFVQYGKLPDAVTVRRDTGVVVPDLIDAPETAQYYVDKVRERARDKVTREAVKRQIEALDQDDATAAIEAATEMVAEASRQGL